MCLAVGREKKESKIAEKGMRRGRKRWDEGAIEMRAGNVVTDEDHEEETGKCGTKRSQRMDKGIIHWE